MSDSIALTHPNLSDRARPEATYEAFSLGENPVEVGADIAVSGSRTLGKIVDLS